MTIKIIPTANGPAGKLAEVEIHFKFFLADGEWEQVPAGDATAAYQMAEALNGTKLIGFAVWETRDRARRNVTFPARQYSVNGERRSFALLRPLEDSTATDRLRDLILAAYAEWEATSATSV